MFDFAKLLDWDYIKDPYPLAPANQTLFIMGGIFIFFILIGVGEWFWLRKLGRFHSPYLLLRGKLLNFFLTFGIVGLLLLFFRFETIPYLASRLLLYILVVAFIIWGGYLLFYLLIIFPRQMRHDRAEQLYSQYLPTNKKRRRQWNR